MEQIDEPGTIGAELGVPDDTDKQRDLLPALWDLDRKKEPKTMSSFADIVIVSDLPPTFAAPESSISVSIASKACHHIKPKSSYNMLAPNH